MNEKRVRNCVAAFLVLCACGVSIYAQGLTDIRKIPGQVVSDGKPTENLWRDLNTFNLIMWRPGFN